MGFCRFLSCGIDCCCTTQHILTGLGLRSPGYMSTNTFEGSLKVGYLFGDEVQVAPNPTRKQVSASSLVWVSEAMPYQVLF